MLSDYLFHINKKIIFIFSGHGRLFDVVVEDTKVRYETLVCDDSVDKYSKHGVPQDIYYDVIEGFVHYAQNYKWSKKYVCWKQMKEKRQVVIILDSCYR